MIYINTNFTETDYQKLTQYMNEIADLKYLEFNTKLIKNKNIKIIGIRIPELKKIAKIISENDYKNFIKINKHLTYEENLLHGLILGYISVSTDELLKLIDDFMPYNDNWAINDTTVSNLKAFKKINISHALNYISSTNPWEIRFGVTLLLNYYIKEENLKTIFKTCDKIYYKDYYVQMSIAWLLSMCYIKYPSETYKYLLKNKLDKFTFNKTISKICDSCRVTKEIKQELKTLRK